MPQLPPGRSAFSGMALVLAALREVCWLALARERGAVLN
jgi:hypothetical protein